MTAKQTDALPTLVLQKEPFPPPQQKTAVLGAIIQPLETSEIITQADSKSPKKVQIMSIPRGFPNQSDYMTQCNQY